MNLVNIRDQEDPLKPKIADLETIIEDEGSGIDPDRVPNLFRVFGELSDRVSQVGSESDISVSSIGAGLTCSRILARAL